MYPLAEGLYAPENQWYVAAFSTEVTRKPLGRLILNQPIVLYRTANGTAVALTGRCPHRHFPLSEAKVVGDTLQCGYHGLTFAPNGACVGIPTQKAIPAACNIRAYPLVERWQWLWIWAGDPALCDESLIPDHAAMDLGNPEFNTVPKAYYLVNGRYMLMHDNLLDLSHIAYLHDSTIGAPEVSAAPEIKKSSEPVRGGARTFRASERLISNVKLKPYFEKILQYSEPVDRRLGGIWHLPSLHALYDDFYKVSSVPDVFGAIVGRSRVYHALTPAGFNSCHYFFASGRDTPSVDNLEDTIKAVRGILDEDVFATEAIEKMLNQLPREPKDVLLRSDADCVAGRRLIEKMIRDEKTSVANG